MTGRPPRPDMSPLRVSMRSAGIGDDVQNSPKVSLTIAYRPSLGSPGGRSRRLHRRADAFTVGHQARRATSSDAMSSALALVDCTIRTAQSRAAPAVGERAVADGAADPRDSCDRLLSWACAQHSFEPVHTLRTDDNAVVQGFVAAGAGVALIPRLALGPPREDVAVRRLKGAPLAREISVAVLRTTAARSIRELVEALTEQARLIQRRWSDADADADSRSRPRAVLVSPRRPLPRTDFVPLADGCPAAAVQRTRTDTVLTSETQRLPWPAFPQVRGVSTDVEPRRFELLTSALQRQRSTN